MNHLTVQIIDDFQEFLSLESEWSSLLAQSSTNSVFLTHEWFRCWWEAFGDKHQMFVICVRNNGKLAGVAPLYLHKTRFRGLPVNKLSFLANRYTAEADLIVASPEAQVVCSIFECLENHGVLWNLFELIRLRHDSVIMKHALALVQKSHWFCRVRSDLQVPYVIVEGNWESFISHRSRRFRKNINYRLNKIKTLPNPVRVVTLRSPDEILATLPCIFKISSESWKAQIQSSITDETSEIKFFKRISAVMGEKGWVNLWMLYFGNDPVAFEYHLNYGGITCPIRADFDETHRVFSPGAHLEYVIMRSLFEKPNPAVTEYNTCADCYPYELRWTSSVRPHKKLMIFRKAWYGRVLYALGLLRRPRRKRVMRSMKSFRPLF